MLTIKLDIMLRADLVLAKISHANTAKASGCPSDLAHFAATGGDGVAWLRTPLPSRRKSSIDLRANTGDHVSPSAPHAAIPTCACARSIGRGNLAGPTNGPHALLAEEEPGLVHVDDLESHPRAGRAAPDAEVEPLSVPVAHASQTAKAPRSAATRCDA